MQSVARCPSPLGPLTLAGEKEALTGLWFDGQKYFASTLPRPFSEKELPVFAAARRWLDLYFSGKDPGFLPPLAPEGSPFRHAVWDLALAHSARRDGHLRRTCKRAVTAAWQKGLRAGGGRRRRAQSPFPHDPLSPRRGRGRKPHGLCGRNGQKAVSAEAGGRGYLPPVPSPKGRREISAQTGRRCLLRPVFVSVFRRRPAAPLYSSVSNTRRTESTNLPKKPCLVSSIDICRERANTPSPSRLTSVTAEQPEKYTAFSKCRYRLR